MAGRRGAQGNVEGPTVFADAHGLEVVHPLAGPDSAQGILRLVEPIGQRQEGISRPIASPRPLFLVGLARADQRTRVVRAAEVSLSTMDP